MIEKYGDIRIFWDGKVMTTHQGQEIEIPEWLRPSLPSISFEGYYKNHTRYPQIFVYDAPMMLAAPYEERINYLEQRIQIVIHSIDIHQENGIDSFVLQNRLD